MEVKRRLRDAQEVGRAASKRKRDGQIARMCANAAAMHAQDNAGAAQNGAAKAAPLADKCVLCSCSAQACTQAPLPWLVQCHHTP